MHNVRDGIISLSKKENVLVRLQVEESTPNDCVVIEIVFLGEEIIPFVCNWEDFDKPDGAILEIYNLTMERMGKKE